VSRRARQVVFHTHRCSFFPELLHHRLIHCRQNRSPQAPTWSQTRKPHRLHHQCVQVPHVREMLPVLYRRVEVLGAPPCKIPERLRLRRVNRPQKRCIVKTCQKPKKDKSQKIYSNPKFANFSTNSHALEHLKLSITNGGLWKNWLQTISTLEHHSCSIVFASSAHPLVRCNCLQRCSIDHAMDGYSAALAFLYTIQQHQGSDKDELT
jgi:hypothetical protein